MSTISNLLNDIDAFLREKAMAETTFGRHAVNDGKFVGRLREGRGVTIATLDRVRSYLDQHRAPPEMPVKSRASRRPKAAA